MTRALGLVVLLAVLAPAVIPTVAPAAGYPLAAVPVRQEEAPAIEVGAAPLGDRAFAFTGRSEYGAETVTLYGYLTAAIGLDKALVFTDPGAPSAATARFTYAGEVRTADRAERNGLTEVSGTGRLTISFDEAAGADFADPASFADGTVVATMNFELRDVLQLPAPGLGVVVGEMETSQTEARSFTLDEQRYRFGHLNARQRLRSVGGEAPGGGDTIIMSVDGTATETFRDPNPSGSPDPTPVTPECVGVEEWLANTTARLERVAAITAEIPADAEVESLDAATLEEWAAEIEALLQAQREAEAPPLGQDANRLVSSAFSRTAQGLRLLAQAAAGDEAALVAGRSALADGATLAARAANELAAVATACGITP